MNKIIWYNLLEYGYIEIYGKEYNSFLQSQLTCDIRKIKKNECIISSHCNRKGRIISLFWIHKIDNSVRLIMPNDVIDIALEHLKKYSFFSKIYFRIKKFSYLGIKIKKNYVFPSSFFKKKIVKIFENKYLYCISKNEKINFEELSSINIWEQYFIKKYHFFLFPETIGKLLPNNTNLEKLKGLSFNKGCFIGQEIIARTHFLGKNTKKLILLHSSGKPKILENIKNEKNQDCGKIIFFSKKLNKKQFCLAIIKNVSYQENKILTTEISKHTVIIKK